MAEANKKDEKKMTVEEAFSRLESIASDLDNPEFSLDEAFQKYTEGMELLKFCSSSIDAIEQKLTVLEEGSFSDD